MLVRSLNAIHSLDIFFTGTPLILKAGLEEPVVESLPDPCFVEQYMLYIVESICSLNGSDNGFPACSHKQAESGSYCRMLLANSLPSCKLDAKGARGITYRMKMLPSQPLSLDNPVAGTKPA